jgi:hypothetical protein
VKEQGMSALAEPLVADARETYALGYLRPALDEAVRTNRPGVVGFVPTSLRKDELVALAVRLVKHEDVNVGVLANPVGDGLMFTPLGTRRPS